MKLEDFLKMIKTGTCPDGELFIRSVYDFDVQDEHLDQILEALKQPNNVRTISLESRLSAVGIQKIAKFLEDNTQIESLNIWNNYGFDKNNNLDYFVPVLQKNKTLKHLQLSRIGVADSNTAPFSQALKNNTTLESIEFYDNDFSSIEVARQIADIISNNTTLKTLSLNGHWFGNDSLALIADSLASNKTLEDLDISSEFNLECDNRDESAKLFAHQLAKNIDLKSLRCFSSKITAPGAIALAKSLSTNNHLISLDLGCNSIDLGSLAFADVLKNNQTLRNLKIAVYSAGNETVKAFADMLEHNTTLTEFDYDPFNTKGDGMDKLRIDMGLTRNEIAYLQTQPCQKENKEKLKRAQEKLKSLEIQYKRHITPPNFSDYVEMRIKAMEAGQGGCCAFPFWSSNKQDKSELLSDPMKIEERSDSDMDVDESTSRKLDSR